MLPNPAITSPPPAAMVRPDIVAMSEKEARAAVATIRECLEKSRQGLLTLYEREGWRALGYSSWSAFVRSELTLSYARVSQLIGAARVERELDTRFEDNVVSSAVFESLKEVPPEERQEVFDLACDLHGSKAPDAKTVQEIIEVAKTRLSGDKKKELAEFEQYERDKQDRLNADLATTTEKRQASRFAVLLRSFLEKSINLIQTRIPELKPTIPDLKAVVKLAESFRRKGESVDDEPDSTPERKWRKKKSEAC